MQAPLATRVRLSKGASPQEAVVKAGAPGVCTSSFQVDVSDLEQARGKRQGGDGALPIASLVSRRDCSLYLNVC